MMKAFNYLNQIKLMDSKIDADIEELANLEALATKTTTSLGDERICSSGSQQKMEAVVIKITELKDRITEEIDNYIDFKEKARKLVHENCDEDCIALITKRYFGIYDQKKGRTKYQTWEQIAIDLDFSFQWVSGGLNARALSQVQEALDAGSRGNVE